MDRRCRAGHSRRARIWLIVENVGDDDSSLSPTAASGEPVAVSANGLATLEQAVGGPVYWVGPRGVSKYEVSQQTGPDLRPLSAGRCRSRRRAGAADGGDVPGRECVRRHVRHSEGTDIVSIPGGGVAAISAARPTSAYVAYPGVDYQIELYDPDPAVVQAAGDERRREAGARRRRRPSSRAARWPCPRTISWRWPRSSATRSTGPAPSRTRPRADRDRRRLGLRPLPAARHGSGREGSGAHRRHVSGRRRIHRHAERRLREAASSSTTPGDGFAMRSKSSKTNVYLAYPGRGRAGRGVFARSRRGARSSSRRERSSPSARDGRTRRPAP